MQSFVQALERCSGQGTCQGSQLAQVTTGTQTQEAEPREMRLARGLDSNIQAACWQFQIQGAEFPALGEERSLSPSPLGEKMCNYFGQIECF